MKVTMKQCNHCSGKFPEELIQTMQTNSGPYTACPICCLKQRNLIHGFPPSTPFNGPEAHNMFCKAVKIIGHAAPDWAKNLKKL